MPVYLPFPLPEKGVVFIALPSQHVPQLDAIVAIQTALFHMALLFGTFTPIKD